MEILKKCSPVTCPMRVTRCNYVLDFNHLYDRARVEWERSRAEAIAGPKEGRAERVAAVDQAYELKIGPILEKDIEVGRVRCKADWEVHFNENLSLGQIAKLLGITRPRVQQIEARARKKLEEFKKELDDYLVSSKG